MVTITTDNDAAINAIDAALAQLMTDCVEAVALRIGTPEQAAAADEMFAQIFGAGSSNRVEELAKARRDYIAAYKLRQTLPCCPPSLRDVDDAGINELFEAYVAVERRSAPLAPGDGII